MGATKYETYTEEQIEYAKIFKALAHPARIAAVMNLMESDGEAGFEELFKNINLSQSTKSEHLKQLTDLGILKTKLVSNGNRSCLRYRLNQNAFKFILKFIDSIYIETKNRTFELDNFYSGYKHHLEWKMKWAGRFQT